MSTRVLIAESDFGRMAAHRLFLEVHGFDVATACDALDCVEKIIETQPDVVVLELELVWGGGEGVLAWMRYEERNASIPVVLTADWPARELSDLVVPPVICALANSFGLKSMLRAVRSACGAPLVAEMVESTTEQRQVARYS
jgi:DNA-binding NtrC family response regulator